MSLPQMEFKAIQKYNEDKYDDIQHYCEKRRILMDNIIDMIFELSGYVPFYKHYSKSLWGFGFTRHELGRQGLPDNFIKQVRHKLIRISYKPNIAWCAAIDPYENDIDNKVVCILQNLTTNNCYMMVIAARASTPCTVYAFDNAVIIDPRHDLSAMLRIDM